MTRDQRRALEPPIVPIPMIVHSFGGLFSSPISLDWRVCERGLGSAVNPFHLLHIGISFVSQTEQPMPAHRISMHKFVKYCIWLTKCSTALARSLLRCDSLSTVFNYPRRGAAEIFLMWPLPEDLAHSALEARLFPKGFSA